VKKSPLKNGLIGNGYCVGGSVLQQTVYKLGSFKQRAKTTGPNCRVVKSQNVNLGIYI